MESLVLELAFKSRALAQAHPLSESSRRYVNHVVGEQRVNQPLPEIGIWAGAAIVEGYCLRRVEEAETFGIEEVYTDSLESDDRGIESEADRLDRIASQLASQIRTGAADYFICASPYRTEDVLDYLIYSQVQRRLDHWRDSIDDAAWKELEEYITWWTVKGYALRCAERGISSVLTESLRPVVVDEPDNLGAESK